MNQPNTAQRRDAALLVARVCMASLFLWSGLEKAASPAGAAVFAASHGVPFAGALTPLAAVFELAAGLMLVTGWRAREAAAALALWILVLGPWFHPFWSASPPQWQGMIDDFFHHFVMLGGMIYLVVFGPGALAVGARTRPTPLS